MGMYVNPGNASFIKSLNSRIFVDKSMLVARMTDLVNTEDDFVCVSRARRFGKSMAANMLSAYFSKGCDSRELFEKLKISQVPGWDRYLNKLNVIKFDVNAFYSDYAERGNLVEIFSDKIKKELFKAYPNVDFDEGDTLVGCLGSIYSATGEQFVIIIDEYDVLIRERVPQPIFDSYLRFLNAMFKNADLSPAIALAYLTGILPIVRDKVESKLNLFQEYTMLDAPHMAEFTGFTTDEVKSLCEEHGMDFDECRRWYDGYRVNGLDIYSPRSVVSAMSTHNFGCYWTRTGSFENLQNFIQMDFMGIREDIKTMLGGGKVDVNVSRFLNTMDDLKSRDQFLTYLIHLGYLTYDEKSEQCSIPNSEIMGEWVNAITDNDNYKAAYELLNASRRLVESAIGGDEAAVADALDRSHQEICNNLNYNNEGAFQAVICLAFFYAKAKYTVIREMTAGKGYADVVMVPYIPNIPAMIIELKRNSGTESALAQIESRRYFASLEKYQGDLLFVGVNYDDKTKEHTCSIRRFVKEG